MPIEKGIAHRPGAFKQSNKEHKHGRHRSKGSISIATKGKVSVKTISKRNKRELNKGQRRHQALQIRQQKRDEVLAKKMSIDDWEWEYAPPLLVTIVPLSVSLGTKTAVTLFTQCYEEAELHISSTGVTHICIRRLKQRFSFVAPPTDNQLAVLDHLKVSDTVLFLISAATGIEDNELLIDKWGHDILRSSFAQGLPTPFVAITDLESIAPKNRQEHKQHIQKLVNRWLPEEKVMVLDKNSDAVKVLRRIGNRKRKSVLYRDRHPHLLGEEVEYVPDSEGTLGTLNVTGFVRGATLSVNQLVHIPGLGDFQLSQIDDNIDNLERTRETGPVRILEVADPSMQESLDAENVPNPMDAEQIWPDYQAAWIPDDNAEFRKDGSEEEELDNEYMDAMSEEYSEASRQEDDNDFVPANDEKYDKEMDFYAEKEELEKIKAAKLDKQFPDEVDTPMDQPARVRFQKYRGLESFRRQNLPSDYARIFQFENFDRTKKRILYEQGDQDGALTGFYITVHVKNVSQLLWSTFKQTGSPVVLFGLFPHEHKMSVLNTVLKRTQDYGAPIKSKERLIFQCGYRRFVVNPVFSSHTDGQKHKFERFFQPNSTAVATFYAPIQFTPAPVLCYKEVNNSLVLVATGSLLSCNPDRLIIKRLVLSGHPLKIHKRSAVIRFMFFNREDIVYFKPCKLRTEMGRSGHIKEPLGTHGHMKCIFDGQLKSHDTVYLDLYKRIFPKWTYEDLVVSCVNNENMETCSYSV